MRARVRENDGAVAKRKKTTQNYAMYFVIKENGYDYCSSAVFFALNWYVYKMCVCVCMPCISKRIEKYTKNEYRM